MKAMKGGGAIRRAVIIGNGFAGAENQCFGLVRALGLSHRYTLYRVNRLGGGINELLRWLPISLHKGLDHFKKQIHGPCFKSSAKDAAAKRIAKIARETFDKDGPLLVIASGRDTISVASSVKRERSEGI